MDSTHEDDSIGGLFDASFYKDSIQTSKTVTPRQIRHTAKMKMRARMRRENANELVGDLPATGEYIHTISNGKFHYWDVVVNLASKLGNGCEFLGSTWTMNRQNALEMCQLLDTGKFSTVTMLVGLYFKTRESSVYATLVNGLKKHDQKIKALETHAKVALLSDGKNHIVIEGSANFTANPRIEQNLIANNEELYNFHKAWIVEASQLE